jgi:hypothetical protein
MTRSESASKMVDLSFHRGRIGARLLCGNNGRLFGLLHDPLVDLLGAFLAKERKSPTQMAEIWNRVLVKRVKRRYRRLARSSRSSWRYDQPLMCLSTTQRSGRSGAMPSRPLLFEPGERPAKIRVLKANNSGSSSSFNRISHK